MKVLRTFAVVAIGALAAWAAALVPWRTHGIDAMADAGAVHLNGSLERLRTDFNARKDRVRLLFIVGPTCGACLRGLDDVNRELVGKVQADRRFHTYVVHVPALLATAAAVPDAMKLMPGPNVTHYWDGDWRSGAAFGRALDLFQDEAKTRLIAAWDVWLIYAPGQTWDDPDRPPVPRVWRHQLRSGPSGLELDPPAFAAEAMKLAGTP
jgi:hypothetical protein